MSLLSSLDLDENLDYRVNMKTYQLLDRYQLIDKCNIILLEKHGQIYLYFFITTFF